MKDTVDVTPSNQALASTDMPHLQYGGRNEANVQWNLIQDFGEVHHPVLDRIERRANFHVTHNLQLLENIGQNLYEFREAIDHAFEDAMRQLLVSSHWDSWFSAYIDHEDLNPSIYLPPVKVWKFDRKSFLDKIFRTFQSNKKFLMDGLLEIRVAIYPGLNGSGRKSKAPKTHNEFKKSKDSIIKTFTSAEDRGLMNSCGYQAIAIGMILHESNNINADRRSLRRSPTKIMNKIRDLILEFPQLSLNIEEEMSISCLQRIQNVLKDSYQIIVIGHRDLNQLFKDRSADTAEKVLYLLYDSESKHYDYIQSMPGLMRKANYCKKCGIGYNRIDEHHCQDGCNKCRSSEQCPDTSNISIYCDDCNKTFHSNECFKKHKENKMCLYSKFCDICEIKYTPIKGHEHKCDHFQCHECREIYSVQPHHCHIKTLDIDKLIKEDSANKILLTFDIECMLEKDNNFYENKPNLVVFAVICDLCLKDERKITDCCELCGSNDSFLGTDCIERFIDRLMILAKAAEKAKSSLTVAAHNNSGYDSHFIYKELLKRGYDNIAQIMNGTKIMKLDLGNIRLIDTCLLFQRPLADLPKTFGIEGEKKGFFPHYLNTSNNQLMAPTLVKNIPKEKYGYQYMTNKRAVEFDKWYSENLDSMFDLKTSLMEYCASDVRVLSSALIAFKQSFKKLTSIDPITRTFTLASIGLEYYRARHLKEKTIGITPIKSYARGRNNSCSANAWLDLMQKFYGENITREYRSGRRFIDGLINKEFLHEDKVYSQIGFEYFGCYFHGCDRCGNPGITDKLDETYESREKYFTKRNIFPEFMRECEWREMLRILSPEAIAYFNERKKFHKNIKDNDLHCYPRRALHGGRTNNLKFSAKSTNCKTLKYYDFTSLYPYVQARRQFPVGHPIIMNEGFDENTDYSLYFGFITCKILPPKNLYIPVLPYSTNGKLLFPLCRKCADDMSNNTCCCSDEERSLTGTYVSIELNKAIEKGYKVVETYEVLHYKDRSDELFKGYIDTFYKIKAEASGYPTHCITEEDKNEYVEKFERMEGISLDKEKIVQNSGLRFIAKLMLNSLWGKLGQRPNQPEVRIVKNAYEVHELFNDETIEILGEVLINDMIQFTFKKKNNELSSPGNTSVAVAAFVTAWARLKLYEELDKIETSNPGSVVYYDTDSIVFLHEEGKYCPKTGNFLGMMTDEIAEQYGTSAQMSEFYSLGPKTYAYKVITPEGEKCEMKAKGNYKHFRGN